MSIPTFPTIVTRQGKGSPLTNAELDANFTNARAYALTLANLISTSINPDGTLVAGSVGSNALQAAAVTLAALNPSLLYSIIPVDTDTGTSGAAYVITARGGLGGSNIVPGGATYDANGNYVLTGLTLNYGYFWTKGANDLTAVVNSAVTVSASAAFTAIASSVTLTGTPLDSVTATVALVAPVNAYRDGQMFFIYTLNASLGGATVNVNNIGAVPILQGGSPIGPGAIAAKSVFAVVYKSGAMVLFSGSSSSSSSSSLTYTFNGTTLFQSGNLPVPGSGVSIQVTHGFGVPPSGLVVSLYKSTADGGPGTVGQYYPVGDFQIGTAPAFKVSFDGTNIYVTQGSGTPSLSGSAITPANWVLVINAASQQTTPGIIFPALSYTFARPVGVISYGNSLFVWNYGTTAPSLIFTTAINLTNNELLPVLDPSGQTAGSVRATHQNHCVFTRADGNYYSIINTILGIYSFPVIQPLTNLVTIGDQYNSSGVHNYAISPGTALMNPAYTITPGVNDVSYSLDNITFVGFVAGVQVTIPTSSAATTLYLKGVNSANVTARITTASATWQPIFLGPYGDLSVSAGHKPVWITEAGGSITDVFVVTSNFSVGDSIRAVKMFDMASGSSTPTQVNTGDSVAVFDFTDPAIVGITPFQRWYTNGSSAAVVTFFQYNPFKRRIYLATGQLGMIHIFQITANTWGNDISAFWGASTDAARKAGLTYIKTLPIAGMGGVIVAAIDENITIEVDQTTGQEKAITYCRSGSTGSGAPDGSVVRIPWVE